MAQFCIDRNSKKTGRLNRIKKMERFIDRFKDRRKLFIIATTCNNINDYNDLNTHK